VISVKSRTVQPAIGRGWFAIFTVLDDELDHSCNSRKAS
jgi:hypothetical protein